MKWEESEPRRWRTWVLAGFAVVAILIGYVMVKGTPTATDKGAVDLPR